jgi:small subunit ribosomal protein S7
MILSEEKKEEAKVEIEAKPQAAIEAPAPEALLTDEASKEKKKAGPKKAAKKEAVVASASSFSEPLLFDKYSMKEVSVNDPSLANYITLTPKAFPNTFGRRKNRVYVAVHVNIIERLINKLMRGGTGAKVGGKVIRTKGALQGKKVKVMHILEDAFEIINKKTGKNPVQVLVNALEYAAPIEDTTRIRYGGINYNVAVGISAARRLDVALRNVALASLISAFKNKKRLADSLADEITLAASKDANSYAIKKKVELERIARSAR